MPSPRHSLLSASLFALAVSVSTPVLASATSEEVLESSENQTPATETEAVDEEAATPDIIVTATRLPGSIDTDAPPIDELSEGDIAAIGASSINDLLAAVAPQAGSGRGRGPPLKTHPLGCRPPTTR